MRIPVALHLVRAVNRRRVRRWDDGSQHLEFHRNHKIASTEDEVESMITGTISGAGKLTSSSNVVRELLKGVHWQHALHAARAIQQSWPAGQSIPCAVVKDVLSVSQTAVRNGAAASSRRGPSRSNQSEVGEDGWRELQGMVIGFLERMDYNDDRSVALATAAQAAMCLRRAPQQNAHTVSMLLLGHGCVDAYVACKLLVALGAASRETRCLPRVVAAMVQQLIDIAVMPAQNSNSDSMHEGLLHGCEVLLRLSQFEAIIDTYRRVPSLPPSFAYIAAHLSVGNVNGAVANLTQLVDNRADWRVFQSSLVLAMHEAARAIGLAGDADEVLELLSTISRFFTPSLFLSRVVESMVSGITERCRRSLACDDAPKPSVAIPPIASVLRAAMLFVGCDLNQDALLSLIDEVSSSPSKLAVPLGVGIVNVIEQCDALGVVKPKKHWYRGYMVQHCRAIGYREHAEHFVAAWDGAVPTIEDNAVSSSWMCKSCGKVNGTRYSFCSCSALQFGVVACSACAFTQDERHASCLVCAAPIGPDARRAVQPLCNWRCHACKAMNMAFQRCQCAKCGAATRPLASGAQSKPPQAQKACCNCTVSSSHRSVAQEPYCQQCGAREAHFTNTASHLTWYCGACGSFHAGIDSICPVFGNSEKLNATLCRQWDDIVTCDACGHEHHNPFVVACMQCNRDLTRVGLSEQPPRHDGGPEQPSPYRARVSALMCTGCCHVNVNARASHACGKCRQLLHDAELTAVVAEPCSHCSHTERSQRLSFVCNACGNISVPPGCSVDAQAGWANVKATIGQLVASGAGPRTQPSILLALEAMAAITSRLEACPKPIHEALQSYDTLLRELVLACGLPCGLETRRCLTLWARISSPGKQRSGVVVPVASCDECGGAHPTVCCGFYRGNWKCSSCSIANTNDGLGRYWCLSCMELRPEIACLSPSAAWKCCTCSTLNLDLETNCVACGHDRGQDDMDAAHCIPLVPSRCDACNRVFLEAGCPYCDAKQPSDTSNDFTNAPPPAMPLDARVVAEGALRADCVGGVVARGSLSQGEHRRHQQQVASCQAAGGKRQVKASSL